MIDYGIQNESSHIRAHVCPKVRRVYTYPTACGVAAIRSGKFRKVNGFQPGVTTATAEGYLVPPFEIAKCAAIQLNTSVWERLRFSKDDALDEKGKKAELLIKQMVLNGLLPIPAIADNVREIDVQLLGGDVIIKPNAIRKDEIVIQVKCDYDGGERELGGTGNLFLQVAESNPLGIH